MCHKNSFTFCGQAKKRGKQVDISIQTKKVSREVTHSDRQKISWDLSKTTKNVIRPKKIVRQNQIENFCNKLCELVSG